MRNRFFISALIIVGAWGIFSLSDQSKNTCVNVYVDFGSLDNQKKIVSCIDINHKTKAVYILEKAGLNLEGTQKYGLDVVCRVNNLPSINDESCVTMPAEKAYWAIITKETGPISIAKKWGWAQTGLSDVYMNPGDSIGLVFTKDGEMKWPD